MSLSDSAGLRGRARVQCCREDPGEAAEEEEDGVLGQVAGLGRADVGAGQEHRPGAGEGLRGCATEGS